MFMYPGEFAVMADRFTFVQQIPLSPSIEKEMTLI